MGHSPSNKHLRNVRTSVARPRHRPRPIHHGNAVATFISEDDGPPLLMTPLLMLHGPLQSFLLVTVCKSRALSRMVTKDVGGGQAMSDCVTAGANGLQRCFSDPAGTGGRFC